MKRKPFNFKKVNAEEADQLNQSIDTLFRNKIEEVIHKNSASKSSYNTYRQAESGYSVDDFISGTSVNKVIGFNTKYATVFSIQLTPVGSAVDAIVSSFTASSMVVKISAETTATKSRFFWRVTGSLE